MKMVLPCSINSVRRTIYGWVYCTTTQLTKSASILLTPLKKGCFCVPILIVYIRVALLRTLSDKSDAHPNKLELDVPSVSWLTNIWQGPMCKNQPHNKLRHALLEKLRTIIIK